ncbi:MAG: hypothetical protein OXI17_10035 [Gammaproteobacteria bacterium]|nr:hypothetical protein [Gammaproteobacteria bacterium]
MSEVFKPGDEVAHKTLIQQQMVVTDVIKVREEGGQPRYKCKWVTKEGEHREGIFDGLELQRYTPPPMLI